MTEQERPRRAHLVFGVGLLASCVAMRPATRARRRRRGDALVRALIVVGVLAVLAGALVGWARPEPRWTQQHSQQTGTSL